MSVSRCRSCNAFVTWARTTGGKNIPLDATANGEPLTAVAGGLRHVRFDGPHRVVEADPQGPTGYRSHFATCPNADAHRRSR